MQPVTLFADGDISPASTLSIFYLLAARPSPIVSYASLYRELSSDHRSLSEIYLETSLKIEAPSLI